MNREIKFRAWDKTAKNGMIYPDGIFHFIANGKAYKLDPQIETDRYFAMPIEIEVMQYTGMKDKNGKEIYEGDICTIKNGDPFAPVINLIVQYELGAFGVMPLGKEVDVFANQYKGKMLPFFPDYKESVLEVIGNIHEHPNLLTP